MKKLASIFILFLAFSFGANAQSKTARSAEELSLMASKQNTLDVANALGVDGKIQRAVYGIFLEKNNNLSKQDLTEAEKKEIYTTADTKLKAVLTKEQVEKLKADGLYDKLTH